VALFIGLSCVANTSGQAGVVSHISKYLWEWRRLGIQAGLGQLGLLTIIFPLDLREKTTFCDCQKVRTDREPLAAQHLCQIFGIDF
jgi:hypothetical protein